VSVVQRIGAYARASAALAAIWLPLAGDASPALTPLPIVCDPAHGASATDSYRDSNGDWWIGDGFADCLSPEFWNGVGSWDDEEPFTYREDGDVRWDGSPPRAPRRG
jgi:hypothetical protein